MSIFSKLIRRLDRVRDISSLCGLWQAVAFEIGFITGKKNGSLRVPGYLNRLSIRRSESDLMVFRTVFIDRELDAVSLSDPRFIIDAGANIGLTTLWFAATYPHAKVIAVEPGEATSEAIRAHCRGIGRVEVLKAALWSEPTTLRIANPDEMSWAHRIEPCKGGNAGSEEDGVSAVTVGDLLARAGAERCDLLKMDIEGAETEVFTKNTESWLDKVDAILVEIHNDAARAAIDRACPSSLFSREQYGEKLLFRRREVSIDPEVDPGKDLD